MTTPSPQSLPRGVPKGVIRALTPDQPGDPTRPHPGLTVKESAGFDRVRHGAVVRPMRVMHGGVPRVVLAEFSQTTEDDLLVVPLALLLDDALFDEIVPLDE